MKERPGAVNHGHDVRLGASGRRRGRRWRGRRRWRRGWRGRWWAGLGVVIARPTRAGTHAGAALEVTVVRARAVQVAVARHGAWTPVEAQAVCVAIAVARTRGNIWRLGRRVPHKRRRRAIDYRLTCSDTRRHIMHDQQGIGESGRHTQAWHARCWCRCNPGLARRCCPWASPKGGNEGSPRRNEEQKRSDLSPFLAVVYNNKGSLWSRVRVSYRTKKATRVQGCADLYMVTRYCQLDKNAAFVTPLTGGDEVHTPNYSLLQCILPSRAHERAVLDARPGDDGCSASCSQLRLRLPRCTHVLVPCPMIIETSDSAKR